MVATKFARTVVKAALRVLKLESLGTDESYQRVVKDKHTQIIAAFDGDAFGIPVVGEREDGSLWIVDGLQRITAVRKMGRKEARCEVFNSRGPEHEASVFKLINMGRTRLTPGEEFKCLLTAHDELAWSIKDAVEAEGFRVVIKKSGTAEKDTLAKQVACINTLMTVAKKYGTDPIRFAIRCADRAWPGDVDGVHNMIIGGMTLFFIRHDKIVDEDRLVPRLQLSTPQKIQYTTVQVAVGNGNRHPACADVIEKLYQKRSGKRK